MDPSGRFALAAVDAPPAVILIDLRGDSGQVSTLLEGASMPSAYVLDNWARLRGNNGAPFYLMESSGYRSTILTETATFGTFDMRTMVFDGERDEYLARLATPVGEEDGFPFDYVYFPTEWP